MKMEDSFPNRRETLSEKEKLLVTSNFSFSNRVFKRLVLQTRENQGLFGKGLKRSWEKEKIQLTILFSIPPPLHNVFYPMKDKFNLVSNI